MVAALVVPFVLHELKATVYKVPGPDEFNFRFIKSFWSLLESDIKEVGDYLYSGGPISAGCNSTFIALIVNIVDHLNVHEYRPISLISCLNLYCFKIAR